MALGEAVTDEAGAYSIPGFKTFPFFIWANPEGADTGFDPQLSSLMVDTASDSFPGGVKTSDAFLQSTSLANITGRLVDETTASLAGKRIQVWEVDVTEPYPAFQEKCEVTTDGEGYFGLSSDDVPCLNLLEPDAVLRFPGDDYHQDEFYDDADGTWSANLVPVNWGSTTDIGSWTLTTRQ